MQGAVAAAMDDIYRELRFRKLRQWLMLGGIDGDEQRQLWRVLAALLHLVEVEGGAHDAAAAKAVDFPAQVSPQGLERWAFPMRC